MTDTRVLLDLDRTLFMTNEFIHDIWQLAAGMYDLDASEQLATTSAFRTYYGDMYDYDFYAHLTHATNGRINEEEFEFAAREQLTGRYLYPDVSDEVLAVTYAVITFGNELYQKLKLSLCPELSAISCHFVLERKGPFIARTYGSQPTVLIDDKCPQTDLPPTARFIHLDRGERQTGHSCRGENISSLAELRSKLR